MVPCAEFRPKLEIGEREPRAIHSSNESAGGTGAELMKNLMRDLWFPGAWVYIPIGLFLAGLAAWAVRAENDLSFYWRDPAAIVNTGPWIGLFSNVGIFIWWIAGAICVFTALVLWRQPGQGRIAAFLLSWGVLTGVLALDDFFMFHEWVVSTYLPVAEDVLLALYPPIMLALVVIFRREILATRFPALMLAFGCLGASALIDVIGTERFVQAGIPLRVVWHLAYVVEDGLKLVGLIAWLHYFGLTSFDALRRALGSGPAATNGYEPAVHEVRERAEAR